MSDAVAAQKLEVVKKFWDAFAGEPITLQRLREDRFERLIEELYPADVVFDLSAVPGWPEAQRYEGSDGIRRFYETWFGTFEEVRFELECLEMLDDLVLSVATQHGTGLSSHTPVAWRDAYLSTVRGSKIVRVQFFADPDDALTAARGSAATE